VESLERKLNRKVIRQLEIFENVKQEKGTKREVGMKYDIQSSHFDNIFKQITNSSFLGSTNHETLDSTSQPKKKKRKMKLLKSKKKEDIYSQMMIEEDQDQDISTFKGKSVVAVPISVTNYFTSQKKGVRGIKSLKFGGENLAKVLPSISEFKNSVRYQKRFFDPTPKVDYYKHLMETSSSSLKSTTQNEEEMEDEDTSTTKKKSPISILQSQLLHLEQLPHQLLNSNQVSSIFQEASIDLSKWAFLLLAGSFNILIYGVGDLSILLKVF